MSNSEDLKKIRAIAEAIVEHNKGVFPPTSQVDSIIERVRKGGDEALLKLDLSLILVNYASDVIKVQSTSTESIIKSIKEKF
ncbi:hypothetical protein [Lelliottia nimipressuralis]|uniref:hypothetical protein n=1 Tax=Lelliottia nimipressuralis TaxID=69220 RepID=UPI0010690AE3|nr:hypothetical protein [Lelliottia nimipressuralis]TFB19766.1 hypothetical protein E3U32_18120 [Lelliottia nimipressuralis]